MLKAVAKHTNYIDISNAHTPSLFNQTGSVDKFLLDLKGNVQKNIEITLFSLFSPIFVAL